MESTSNQKLVANSNIASGASDFALHLWDRIEALHQIILIDYYCLFCLYSYYYFYDVTHAFNTYNVCENRNYFIIYSVKW